MSLDFIFNNLKDSLASIIILIGVVFSFVSLIEEHRVHSEKLFALLFLAGISLFANDPVCYFATLFIIATVVTNLDFLQNIAAIIKGSKEYFDYKISTYNQEDKIRKELKSQDVESGEGRPLNIETDTLDYKKSKPVTVEFYSLAETLTLNYFEKIIGKPIVRNLRFRKKNIQIEIDGLIQQEHTDILFEIKIPSKNRLYLRNITEYLSRATKLLNSYKDITDRDASIKLVIVLDNSPEEISSLFNEKTISNLKNSNNVSLEFISYDKIGLNTNNN